MPFTVSHAAAVLPLPRLSRDRLPLAALIAGSVSPDLGYYFGFTSYLRSDAHSFDRSFTFCLPIAFALLALLFVLHDGLARLLPPSLGALLRDLFARPLFSPKALPFTLLAILLGAWSHQFWDAWTHYDGYFVNLLPVLQTKLFGGPELFRIGQHGSTLFGGAALYLFAQAYCRRLGVPFEWRFSRRWILWALLVFSATLFTVFTLTESWNYALANNDRRLWFLFIVSLVRNNVLLVLLASAAASWKVSPAPQLPRS